MKILTYIIISLVILLSALHFSMVAQSQTLPNLDDPDLEAALNEIQNSQAANQLSAADNGSADQLEQISPADLQQLQGLIKSLSETPQLTSNDNAFKLDLVWKANTLVPYDYPGKALPGSLSGVVVYALANVSNPSKLNYSWIVDDASSYREGPDQEGIGKDTFTFATFQLPSFTHQIRVTAQDPDTERSATATLTLKTKRPEVYFYLANNNNYNNMAPDTISFLPGATTNLLTRIFYSNATSLSDFDFQWYLDNKLTQENNAQPEILPIHISEQTPPGIQTSLRLELINNKLKKNINERAGKRVNIQIVKPGS